jgi:dihydrofolate reductase
MVAAF